MFNDYFRHMYDVQKPAWVHRLAQAGDIPSQADDNTETTDDSSSDSDMDVD